MFHIATFISALHIVSGSNLLGFESPEMRIAAHKIIATQPTGRTAADAGMVIAIDRAAAPLTGCVMTEHSCLNDALPELTTDSIDIILSVSPDVDVGNSWAVIKDSVIGCSGSMKEGALAWNSLNNSLQNDGMPSLSSSNDSILQAMLDRLHEVQKGPNSAGASWWSIFSRGLGELQWQDADLVFSDYNFMFPRSLDIRAPSSFPSSGTQAPNWDFTREFGGAWLEGTGISVWAKPVNRIFSLMNRGSATVCLYPRATAQLGIPIARVNVPLSLFPGGKVMRNKNHSTKLLSSKLVNRADLFDGYFAPMFEQGNVYPGEEINTFILPLALLAVTCASLSALAHAADFESKAAEDHNNTDTSDDNLKPVVISSQEIPMPLKPINNIEIELCSMSNASTRVPASSSFQNAISNTISSVSNLINDAFVSARPPTYFSSEKPRFIENKEHFGPAFVEEGRSLLNCQGGEDSDHYSYESRSNFQYNRQSRMPDCFNLNSSSTEYSGAASSQSSSNTEHFAVYNPLARPAYILERNLRQLNGESDCSSSTGESRKTTGTWAKSEAYKVCDSHVKTSCDGIEIQSRSHF